MVWYFYFIVLYLLYCIFSLFMFIKKECFTVDHLRVFIQGEGEFVNSVKK